MKKLLFAFVCGFGLAATAQVTTTDIAVSINTPTPGQSISPGVQFNVNATITNNGTTALTPVDSIICFMVLNGQPITNSSGQVFGRIITENIPVNGTTTFDFPLGFGSITGFTDPANFCVVARHISATDTDTLNNASCNQVSMVNGAVSTDDVALVSFEDKTTFANGNLNVDVNGVGIAENITIEVINISGQVVANQRVQANQGRVTEQVAISSVSGILIYRIIGEDGKIHATNKFMAL